MESQIERISAVEARVTVEIPWDEVSGRLSTKLRELRGRARIPGFRPGKVPPQVIERMYGRSVRQELAQDLMQETFQTAVSQHNTVALTQPLLESSTLEKGQPFTYAARFEVPPQIEPKDYTGVDVVRRPAKVDDEKVDAELTKRQEQLTQLLPVPEGESERVTAPGDVWTVDVEGALGETTISRKDVRVEIGSSEGELIPGIAVALEGTSLQDVGGTRELVFTPPQDRVRPEYKDQEAKLKLGLREVKIKHIPERDDELARDTGEAETLAELEDQIRKAVLEADQDEAERDARRALVGTLLDRNPVDPAPSMVAREVQAQVNMTKQQLAGQGMDLSAIGTTEAQLAAQIRPQALFNVRAYLLLDAIGKAESIDTTDEEVDQEVERVAEERGQNAARTRATMEKDGQLLLLRAQLREEKILDFLMEKASVTEGEPGFELSDAGAPEAEARKKKATKKKAAKKKAAKKKAAKKTAKKASEGGKEPGGKKAAKKKSQGSRRRRRTSEED